MDTHVGGCSRHRPVPKTPGAASQHDVKTVSKHFGPEGFLVINAKLSVFRMPLLPPPRDSLVEAGPISDGVPGLQDGTGQQRA